MCPFLNLLMPAFLLIVLLVIFPWWLIVIGLFIFFGFVIVSYLSDWPGS